MVPKIAIVGRPNVGKSSLLNMLAGRRVSIVDAAPGVTRDRIATQVELPGPEGPRHVELVDTGGHGIEDAQDLTALVERQIAIAVEEADAILFVVDAMSGIVTLDEQVARLLRMRGRNSPVLLVANKVDGPMHEPAIYEAIRLGAGDPIGVSATNGYNKAALIEAMVTCIDWSTRSSGMPDDPGIRIAIVGKRNAGKSTLVNALAGRERVIVSDVEGTTRDSVDVRIELKADPRRCVTLIDTAGARKRKSITADIEFYGNHRALRSVRRADVVLLLIDAEVPLSQVDTALAREILRHFKPCVVVVNKWDLAEADHTQQSYVDHLDRGLKGLSFAPIAFISAAAGDGLDELMAMALNLQVQASHRVPTGPLNRTFEQILAERTPVSKVGKRPKVYYVTQLGVHPPTIGLFVNEPDLFDGTYQRFVVNRLRDVLPFSEVPIQLLVRARQRMPRGANAPSHDSS